MSDFEPFYDVSRSYEDNYEQGPFGAFAEALKDGNGADAAGTTSEGASASFLGQPVNLPFGIPAGPLLNSRFTTAAFHMGFDLATYKTVRSCAWGCNPFPNVLAVHPKSADGSLTPGSAELDEGVLADTNYEQPISISNSFGVPSQSPDVWQPDMRAAIEAAGPGQVLVPSFQGSRVEGMSEEEYIADHATTARLVKETGAKLMVMNTSCPNEGHNRLLCHDPLLVGRITEAVKQEIGDIPLMVKLAYIPSDGDLELMVRSTVGHGTVQDSAPSIRFPPNWSMPMAIRPCPVQAVIAPACVAMRFVVPASTWSPVWPRSARSSVLISRSMAWAAWFRRPTIRHTETPARIR